MSQPETRVTKQRLAVTEALSEVDDFATAQQLHRWLQDSEKKVSLATVYRLLQSMADDGLVDVLRSGDGEARFRRCVTEVHHHHLVCRSCSKTVEDCVYAFVQCLATRYHTHRIEVALHWPFLLQITGEGEWHAPVETDRIGAGLLAVILQQDAGALGKRDDAGIGTARTHGLDDAGDGLHRVFFELFLAQYPSPGIENLHSIRAGVQLRDEIICRDLRQER